VLHGMRHGGRVVPRAYHTEAGLYTSLLSCDAVVSHSVEDFVYYNVLCFIIATNDISLDS